MGVSSNFDFLTAQDERLARLGAMAERYFFDDAPSTKLRQLAEFLAKEVAARHGLLPPPNSLERAAKASSAALAAFSAADLATSEVGR
jgi:hypothetical protein